MTSKGGLDEAMLRGLWARRRPSPQGGADRDISARIRDHLDAHDGYLAWSGGKDSTAVLHLALQAEPNVPVVWFDSGLEYPETTTYIADLAAQWNINLSVLKAEPTALDVLVAHGGWDHQAPEPVDPPDLHETLISRPAEAGHADHGPGELLGLRKDESKDRRRNFAFALRRELATCACCDYQGGPPSAEQRTRHGGVVRRKDGTVAYSPIWDWSTDRVHGYLTAHEVPLNPLYEKLAQLGVPEEHQRVGLVLDANGLEFGRVGWIKRGWPDLYRELATRLPRLPEWT